MNGPRVLHVCAVEYSARTLLMPQLRHQAERGFDVRLACAPDTGNFGADLARFRPETVPFPRDVVVPAGGFALPTFLVGNSSNVSMTGNVTLGKAAAVASAGVVTVTQTAQPSAWSCVTTGASGQPNVNATTGTRSSRATASFSSQPSSS